MRRFPWQRVQQHLAERLSTKFSAEELNQILVFYRSPAGRKLLTLQPLMLSDIVRESTMAVHLDFLRQRAVNNVSTMLKSMDETAQKAVRDARLVAAYPEAAFAGTWYGRDIVAGESTSCWRAKKLAGGLQIVDGVDLNETQKTYTRYQQPGHWFVEGRLLIETAVDDPEICNLYIVDEIADGRMVYRFVDSESPVSDWIVTTDTQNELKFPAKPDGYDVTE